MIMKYMVSSEKKITSEDDGASFRISFSIGMKTLY